MPWWITWPGIAICVAVIAWKGNFVQVSHTSAIPQIVMVIGAFALAFGTLLYLDQKRTSPSEQQDEAHQSAPMEPEELVFEFEAADDLEASVRASTLLTALYGRAPEPHDHDGDD